MIDVNHHIISFKVCDCAVHHRKTHVLSRNVFGSIQFAEFSENMGN